VASPTRRDVLRTAGLGAGAALTAPLWHARPAAAKPAAARPNFLVVLCDQLGLDAIGAHGCKDVHTPNLDRLVARGTTFLESHSTNPVCSPARSSIVTGCMPVETGVISNNRAIHPSCPNLGQWFRPAGYETLYCGKWHLPGGYQPKIDGFTVLPVGRGQGDLVDTIVSRSCEAYLTNRSREKPFLMVASFMQPHDICYWGNHVGRRIPPKLAFERIRDRLPELPPNHAARPAAPAALDRIAFRKFSQEQWRYYLYIYARMVEMLDADVGRLLHAVEASGQADNTVILFTADHGDGRGRHMHVSKWYPYEEAVKVPMVVSCPGRIAENARDAGHLVSGVDVMPTLCDFAGIQPPRGQGLSLRPLLEGRSAAWRDVVVSEHRFIGRSLRSKRFKYVVYKDDPVEQLFDMKNDPWETKNLYKDAAHASVLAEHRKLLEEFQGRLKVVPPMVDVHAKRLREQRQRQKAARSAKGGRR